MSLAELLTELIASPPAMTQPNIENWHRVWLDAQRNQHSLFAATVVAGFSADRMAGAFAAGYQAAIRHLVPDLMDDQAFITFSVTEAEGNRPRHIQTTLSETANGYLLTGQKHWATMSTVSTRYLVAARRNSPEAERPELVMVIVDAPNENLTTELMPPTPFVPEISHGRLRFENVQLSADAVLPGDGYDHYIKPFRMIEDCYVTAGIAAYLLRLAADHHWPDAEPIRLLAILSLLESATQGNQNNAVAKLLFDQARSDLDAYVDATQPRWEMINDEARQRWQRDSPLLGVAGKARTIRRSQALTALGLDSKT